MRKVFLLSAFLLACGQALAQTTVAYTQAPLANPNYVNPLIASSRTSDPNGTAYDAEMWDGFMTTTTVAITGLTWRGGFNPQMTPANDIVGFDIRIRSSIANGTEPDLSASATEWSHWAPSNAGATAAGTVPMVGSGSTVAMFDYSTSLPPELFTATANTRYWIKIQAVQTGNPDWGLAKTNTGNNGHWTEDTAKTIALHLVEGDGVFTLTSPAVSAVPEPESVALFAAMGVLGFTFWHRNRRQSAKNA